MGASTTAATIRIRDLIVTVHEAEAGVAVAVYQAQAVVPERALGVLEVDWPVGPPQECELFRARRIDEAGFEGECCGTGWYRCRECVHWVPREEGQDDGA